MARIGSPAYTRLNGKRQFVKVRVQRNGSLERGDGCFVLAHPEQRPAKRDMSLWQIGPSWTDFWADW